jgi:RHS repeat-associated protein
VETVVNGLPATLAYAFTYDNVADRRSMTLGNGVTETSDFDAVHRPTSIAWSGLAELTLGYDNVGNVSSLTDNTSSAAPTPFWLTKYDYVGNRLDNVVDSTLRHYLYDDAGNTTDDGMRTFIYDQGQRLVQVKQGTTILVENEYDGKGRRVIKRANDGATVTVFHYDLFDRLIAETDGQGNLKVEYIYMEGRPLAQIRHTGSSEAVYYYHADHLGTPRMMTNNAGAVVWRVETDPFGNEIGTPIKTVENNLRFPGQYFDAETGLHQNYFRTYDPTLGRYREADPIGLEGGENPYIYVFNNPLNLIDPSGLGAEFDDGATIFKHIPIGGGGGGGGGGFLKGASGGGPGQSMAECAARGAAQMPRHHRVPIEILKQLPEDVANNPLVRGRAGAPNRWSIPRDLHESIHRGPGGGAYNETFKQRLGELGREPTVHDVLRIRDDLVKQFGLEGYRP